MRTIILFATKYGATKMCAEKIAAQLPDGAELHDLESTSTVDLAPYDCIILGTAIYMGKPRKAMHKFLKANEKALLEKKLGLYLCCIQDITQYVKQQFEVAYPKAVREHATAMEQLGGMADFTKLKSLDRMIMNMVAGDLRKKIGGDVVSTISDERIASFCRMLL